ncbi:hypothetical protein J2W57_000084 [Chryseobacterium ginsenosidimutans]|uniref:Uncharacterized protein n=1 Tax=Chryseobacterium geocarposphaerae TaxID=1416776 RepID=A0ABU1L8Z3_9FLAO|nr:hypothetical protein [Chryseobacterium geocarposphaerae]MDR6696735.1 hypothetical protein [Chryseobacterium ginsenosidimutans]
MIKKSWRHFVILAEQSPCELKINGTICKKIFADFALKTTLLLIFNKNN